MEQNIYEDPGQCGPGPVRPDPLPPHPPSLPPHPPSDITVRDTTIKVERGGHGASTAASDPFSCHFEDTFTETTEPRVPTVISNCYKITYSYVLNFFYIFLSVLVGPILVVAFGLILGLTSFTITWVLSPIFRCTGMCFVVWERFIAGFLNCCLAPYCKVLGSCCSRMVVRYQKVPSEVIHL